MSDGWEAGGADPVVVVCVGAGPAAIMLLERLIANHERDRPGLPIELHLVDPHHPGGGRIWRRDQSPLLKLNSMLEDVACFTDPSCTLDGPVAPGLSLAEWVRSVRAGEIAMPEWADEAVEREIREIEARDFPTRRLNSAYLGWVYEETLRRASDRFTVEWHRDIAVAVEDHQDSESNRSSVHLASGAALDADILVYALGHNGTEPSSESKRLAGFARRNGLEYVAPAFTADLSLDHLRAGTDVIVRGMGLAAIDLIVMLTSGRGGRFFENARGALQYAPSGREPVLHLGSRRGVPYRSKITSRMVGDATVLEYVGAEFRAAVEHRDEPLDFERDVWPLVANELITGYYRELFTGHAERVVGDWAAFWPLLRAALARDGGYASAELAELIATHVPDCDDRFDLEAFERPLGFAPAGREPQPPGRPDERTPSGDVHHRVVEHVSTDLRHRTAQRHSATQALFMTGLHVYISLAEIPPERWNARSRTQLLPRRWHATFSYLASGPPGHRLAELLALADAGVVRFLGGELQVSADEDGGAFTATGTAVVSETAVASASITASTLIDAWLPEARASRSDNPLLRQLVASGRVSELTVGDAGADGAADGASTTGQIETGPGGRIPGRTRQFGLGPFVAGPTGGAFTRPGLDSLPFRIHDRVARAILAEAAEVAEAAEAAKAAEAAEVADAAEQRAVSHDGRFAATHR